MRLKMNKKVVLVLNAGSSSLKFALIDTKTGLSILTGLGECFGLPQAKLSWSLEGQTKQEQSLSVAKEHHQEAIYFIVKLVKELAEKAELVAVGHRVVHGAEKFDRAVLLTDEIICEIESLNDLAPLHNPANIMGIKAAMAAFPALSHIAVFDTAFHQSMPEKAYMGGIAKRLYDEYSIRRYGFHGTSHYYVTKKAAERLEKPLNKTNVISVHLGNGASVCVVKNGKSIDTSMGFTPLAGLMMGTRSGDLDPGIIEFLLKKGWTPEEVFDTLNKKSGFLGVSGLTSDARGILEAMEQGHKGATLAFELFTYRVAKYIGSYLVALDSLDAIIFTGGIGENSLPIRRAILNQLTILGFVEDGAANEAARFGQAGIIAHSTLLKAVAMVIPTNEELVIAEQSLDLLS